MFASQIKAGAVSAIALAMTLGLAAPASATTFTLSSDKASLSIDEVATLTTDATENDNVAAIFVNGVFYEDLSGATNGVILPWSIVGPCATVDVTLRLYYVAPGSPPPVVVPTFATPYAAEVHIEFVGSAAAPCDPTWGTGLEDEDESGGSDDSGEPLAKTGSDASAVAGLTGVAGVAAIAVAVAVALRTRRAQR